MLALIDSHMFVHKMTALEFFRNAYYWRFSKDITTEALGNDSDAYQKHGKVPPYAVDYTVHIYGCTA